MNNKEFKYIKKLFQDNPTLERKWLTEYILTEVYKDDNLNDIEAEANLGGTMTFRNWTDSLNENVLPQEKFAQEYGQDLVKKALSILPQKGKYNLEDYTVKVLPLDKVKPTQFGEDYINASSEYEAEQYQKYIEGKIDIEDLRKEDFYPIVVDRDTMEILDGNHRHAVHTMLGIPKIKAILVSKKLNEAKKPYKHKHGFDYKLGKDPFGLNQYARELAQGLEEELSKEYIIYSDMDGVLTDFDTQFKKFTNNTPLNQFETQQGTDKFWQHIDNIGIKFWTEMPWMSDGKIYWDYIKKYNPKLLSAPSRDKSSKIGKHVWVKKHLPGTKLILSFAPQKQRYASPNSILIDDKEENIQQWIEAGGIGILHTSAENTIIQLKELGL